MAVLECKDRSSFIELLRSIKDDLTPPARFLLHRAAYEKQDYTLVDVTGDPSFDPIRDNPAFQEFINDLI